MGPHDTFGPCNPLQDGHIRITNVFVQSRAFQLLHRSVGIPGVRLHSHEESAEHRMIGVGEGGQTHKLTSNFRMLFLNLKFNGLKMCLFLQGIIKYVLSSILQQRTRISSIQA